MVLPISGGVDTYFFENVARVIPDSSTYRFVIWRLERSASPSYWQLIDHGVLENKEASPIKATITLPKNNTDDDKYRIVITCRNDLFVEYGQSEIHYSLEQFRNLPS